MVRKKVKKQALKVRVKELYISAKKDYDKIVEVKKERREQMNALEVQLLKAKVAIDTLELILEEK